MIKEHQIQQGARADDIEMVELATPPHRKTPTAMSDASELSNRALTPASVR